jgi:hypothetical protein
MALRAVPGSYADLIEAMQFGLDHGPVDLFTMSAGWGDPPADLKEGNRANAEILLAMGIPWFCAAGNGDNYGGHYAAPQTSTLGRLSRSLVRNGRPLGVVTVGATTSADASQPASLGPTVWNLVVGYGDYPYPRRSSRTSRHRRRHHLDDRHRRHAAYSGTSMATPLAAGAASLPAASPGFRRPVGQAPSRPPHLGTRTRRQSAPVCWICRRPAAVRGQKTLLVHNDGPLPLQLQGAAWTAGWLAISPRTATVAPGTATMRARSTPGCRPACTAT